MKVAIELCYTISSHATIDLPGGKTWDDVKDYYVKWGTLFLQFEPEGEFFEFDCGDASMDSVDWKYPTTVRVFETIADSDGTGEIEADYDKCLAEINP